MMEKIFKIIVFVIVGGMLLTNIVYRCMQIDEEAFMYMHPQLFNRTISYYIFDMLFVIVAFIGLFLRKPIGYFMFMILPFYCWSLIFEVYFTWGRALVFGLIIPVLLNLNFMRSLYVTDNKTLLHRLLWAMGVGFTAGLIQLLL